MFFTNQLNVKRLGIALLFLVTTLPSFAQDEYTSFDWAALANNWIPQPTEYKKEKDLQDELLSFRCLTLELTGTNSKFTIRLSPQKVIKGAYDLEDGNRIMAFWPENSNYASIKYAVVRVESKLLVLEKSSEDAPEWPTLLALMPAINVSGGLSNSQKGYIHQSHGYSCLLPKGWVASKFKHQPETDGIWFGAASNSAMTIDYAPFGYGLKINNIIELLLKKEDGHFASKGKIATGKKIGVEWYNFYYEHGKQRTNKLVYIFVNKGVYALLSVEMPAEKFALQKKEFDTLIKTFKWL